MPRFTYQATDSQGTRQTGTREAADPGALEALLVAEGCREVRIEPTAGDSTGDVGRLSPEQSRQLAGHVAGLARAGLSLPEGLRALASDLPDRRLRAVMLELAGQLDGGQPLEQAIRNLGNRFPPQLQALMLAAAGSGHVGEVLGEFVEYSRARGRLRRTIGAGLAYPLILVATAVALFLFICFVLVAQFEKIFLDFGIRLPIMTRLLIDVSRSVRDAQVGFILTPIVMLGVLWLAWRFLLDRPSRGRILGGIPMLGTIWRLMTLSQFAHQLGLLIDCKLPTPEALPLAAQGTDDPALEEAAAQMGEGLRAGLSLGQASAREPAIPRAFGRVLAWAEGYQSLPETLHMVGELFEAQARSRSSFAVSILSVTTLVFVLWAVAFLVVALFLPLISLISALSG